MLIGREVEQERIERLLGQARSGRGGALVLRGEAGIGKTALLERAAERARDFRVLRALGVESEAELPFAGLHELVYPVADLIDQLPEPQAFALRAALALAPADGVERFSAYAATLSLLGASAADRPLACLVDDAHWLDQSSAAALTFAARRIEDERVAILFAARDPTAEAFVSAGLDEFRLGGLRADEAKTLLASAAPTLTAPVTERLVQIAGGNPLALLEFGSALTGVDLEEPVEQPLPVDESVQQSFLERSARLSTGARRALLLAAAGDPAEPDAIWAALEREGLSAEAVSEAEGAGLLIRAGRFAFCHPLARSAVYQAAVPAELGAAHRVLAETTRQPDRRAWHLAAAASGPDEQAAMALDEAAAEARQRGGIAAEARALERAAGLTPDSETRAGRLLKAGFAAEAVGRHDDAERLLSEAAELTTNAELRADAVARRSYLLFDRGEFDRALELARGEVAAAVPATAARILTASGVVHSLVHRLAIPDARASAERAAELAGGGARHDLDLGHMLAWTWELSGRSAEALELARECVEHVEPGSVLAIDFAIHFIYLEDYPRARALLEQIVAHERAVGALNNLAYALDNLANLDLRTGRLTTAYGEALESVQLTEPFANDVALASSLARLALIEATMGRSEDARAHGTRALEVADGRGDRWNAVRARAALGLDAFVYGDVAAAVQWLEPATQMLNGGGVRHPNMFRVHADLIEAQARLGRRDEATGNLARLQEDAEATESSWASAVAERCMAVLSDDPDCDAAFVAALELADGDAGEFERARTQLAYGERLRRARRRRDAREQLHAGLEAFERLGARPWTERARAELRATGERLRRRGPLAHEELTPQELQAALAAAEGLTNKEIAARLFLSPKTVEFHLSRVYRKLDVRSRTELARVLPVRSDVRDSLPA